MGTPVDPAPQETSLGGESSLSDTDSTDSEISTATAPTTVQTHTSRAHPTDNSDTSTMIELPHRPAHHSEDGSQVSEEYIPYADDIPTVDNIPAPASRSQLPCPHEWEGCCIKFDLRERRKWKMHSIDHFWPHAPPKAATCTFPDCGASFSYANGYLTWNNLMDHFADHYEAKLTEFRDALGKTDENEEGRMLLDFTQSIDVNVRQYMIHHDISARLGMDMDINPNPPSELDRIPLGYMNRMPQEYGGRRVREVVFGPVNDDAEPNLDSRSAGIIHVSKRQEGRRRQGTTAVRAAKTSWGYTRPSYPRLSQLQNSEDRRIARTERIIFFP